LKISIYFNSFEKYGLITFTSFQSYVQSWINMNCMTSNFFWI